ncbi:hypothetical protein BDW72DRAFT_183226 [Aspergillus terricola var. indicus]
MQQRWQQPRFDIIAYLRSHGRQVRQKVKEICLSKHNRLLPTLLDRAKQKVERQRRRGFRSDSSDVAHYREFSTARSDSQSAPSARRLPVHSTRRVLSSSRTSIADTLVGFHVSNVPVKPDISPERSDFDKRIDRPFDILLRLPGDGPDQTHQAVASIDTQLMKVNLMRREVWDERLNEHGRGHLELDHNAYVTTIKSERIPIMGVARGVEWHLKYGPRTYTSDFHVIEMGGFDILIGSDTITQYGLVSAGFDLRYHMRRTDANERYQESQIEHHTTDP